MVAGSLPVLTVLNTIPFGIGVAASTRVGNLLGLQSAAGARQASHASALLSIVVGSAVMFTMMAFKDVRPVKMW
jgi:MATE family multidrug resistance protein